MTARLGVWRLGMEEGSREGRRGDVLDPLFLWQKQRSEEVRGSGQVEFLWTKGTSQDNQYLSLNKFKMKKR